MNLNHLQTFLTIAHHGKFSIAAKVLHISQPAISMQIQALEEHFGCRLLDRNGKKISLTPTGEILKKHAERILGMCSEVEKEINEAINLVKGDLKIGASMTIGGYYLPSFLKEFFAKYPQVKISMLVKNSENILEGVQKNNFDLGLVEGELEGHNLPSKVFAHDEMVVVVPAGHFLDLANRKSIEVQEFLQYPLVLREEGSGTRNVLEISLQTAGVDLDSLKVAMELGSIKSIKSAVEEGIGISVLPRWTIKKEVDIGTLKEIYLNNIPMKRTFKIVYDERRFQTIVVKRFINELLQFRNFNVGDDNITRRPLLGAEPVSPVELLNLVVPPG